MDDVEYTDPELLKLSNRDEWQEAGPADSIDFCAECAECRAGRDRNNGEKTSAENRRTGATDQQQEANNGDPEDQERARHPIRQRRRAATYEKTKKKTYKQALYGRLDAVTISFERVKQRVKELRGLALSPTAGDIQFTKMRRPPPPLKDVEVTAFWVIDTPDPQEVSFKV